MKVLLIDGNNLLIRAIRATERVPLSADGVSTAALLVFINCLSRYVKEEQPDRVAVCWDGGNSAYRLRLWPSYKGERKKAPHGDGIRTAFALAKEFCTLVGLHHVEVPGYEADDLIAYYWRQHRTDQVVILSNDKDFMQLLSEPNIVQVRVSSSGTLTDRWDMHRVMRERGCHAEHLPLVMALTGDVGDGIPGIPGFGVRTAVKYLSQSAWSLDRLERERNPKIKGHMEQIRLNYRLVNLRDPIPGLVLPALPPFCPTQPGGAMYGDFLAFLSRYKLQSVRSRYFAGKLWKEVDVKV